MSEDGFLARWSRRKRAAKAAAPSGSAAQPPRPEPPREASANSASGERAAATAAPAELPPVEAIDAATELRGFFADGVPPALLRAALRRAWTADPDIRDFVGLSENAWDFTAAQGVPGFGALSPEDVRRLLAGEDETAVAATPAPASPAPAPETTRDEPAHDREPTSAKAAGTVAPDAGEADAKPALPRRHGGALPG